MMHDMGTALATRIYTSCVTLFSVDVRALALMRILFGLIVIYDLLVRLTTIQMDYASGIFPLTSFEYYFQGRYNWSFHTLFNGDLVFLSILFAAHFACALALTLGWRARLSAFGTLIFLISLHNANPLMVQGGDIWLRVTLFVLMFLPLGARWSIDAARATTPRFPLKISGGWTAALLIQIACFYFFASQLKTGYEWQEGTAIYYTLASYYYIKGIGFIIFQSPLLMYCLTYAVVVLQTLTPLLLFSPIYNRYTRSLVVTLLVLMHTGLGLSIRVGYFSIVSLTVLSVFTPRKILDLIERYVPQRYRGESAPSPEVAKNIYIETLAVLYIIYVVLSQAATSPHFKDYLSVPAPVQRASEVLLIGQHWNIFTQELAWRGWHIIAGERADGTIIDILNNGELISFERPEKVADRYHHSRWRRYLSEILNDYNSAYRAPTAAYLCSSWNTTHTDGERLDAVTIIYMGEHTPPPGYPPEAAEPFFLVAKKCE